MKNKFLFALLAFVFGIHSVLLSDSHTYPPEIKWIDSQSAEVGVYSFVLNTDLSLLKNVAQLKQLKLRIVSDKIYKLLPSQWEQLSQIKSLENLELFNIDVEYVDDLLLLKELSTLDTLKLTADSQHFYGKLFFVTNENLLSLKHLSSLSTLDLSGRFFNQKAVDPKYPPSSPDTNLMYLSELSQIENLKLNSVSFTADQIEQMSFFQMPGIKSFEMQKAAVNQIPFETLFPYLEVLDLVSSDATSGIVKKLTHLPYLKAINLSQTKVTHSALSHLSKIPSLTEIHLESLNLDKADFTLLSSLPLLKILNLKNSHILKSDLEGLKSLKQLEQLDLSGITNINITQEDLSQIELSLPHCKVIW